MFTPTRLALSSIALAAVLGTAGCAGMSERDRSTAIGAGVGGVAGSVLSGGSTAGTVAGAVIGGAVGNQIEKKKND